jgi:broad specificity phosphatase PhoE
VRHGETALNRKTPHGDSQDGAPSAERIRGWRDVPLDDTGKAQALAIASHLADKYAEPPGGVDSQALEGDSGGGIHEVLASSLSRAVDTAQAIANVCHAGPVRRVHALRPWNLGDFTGKSVVDVLPEIKRLAAPEYAGESAPGGESFARFVSRYLEFLMRQLASVRASGETHVLVTHTRNIQATRAWLAAGAHADGGYNADVMNDYKDETPPGAEYIVRPK